MECTEKQLWEHVPGSSVTVGISVDVEGVGSTADTAVGMMLPLTLVIDAVTLLLILLLGGNLLVDILCGVLPILLLGGKVFIVGPVLSTLMLVLGTVVVLVLSTVAGEMVVVIAAKLTLVLTGKTTQVMVTVGVSGVMVFTDVSLPRMVVSV